MSSISRRSLLLGSAAGAFSLVGLSACSPSGTAVGALSDNVRRAEAARRVAVQRLVTARLSPRVSTVDLGGVAVDTWAYGESVPGPLLRATAGDLLRVTVDNALPAETSVHWHGVALRNDMDGVPGMTQKPIGTGGRFLYEFTAPDPGTYFYHPHSGVQLHRGLYGVLVVDDPREPGDYDLEWVVVLDDWVDGTGPPPTTSSPASGPPQATDRAAWVTGAREAWAGWATAPWAWVTWGRRCPPRSSAEPATWSTRTTS